MILCGGAFNSPQLLQLSGVGEADHLNRLGIDVVADVPGVGANLQDHLEVYIQHSSTQPVSMQPHLATWRRPGMASMAVPQGPGHVNQFEAGGFVRSNDDVAYPNLMYHFLPLAVRYDGTTPTSGRLSVHVGPMYSNARGAARSPRPTRARTGDPVQLPVDRAGPSGVGRGDPVTRNILGQGAFAALRRRRAVAPGPTW